MELASEAIFRDDGYSGATLNRPGLDRLRDAVRAGEVEQVLVTDPDRLARNYVQLMVLLEELERSGCEVAFLDRPMGRDPQDQLLLQIRGAVAEYERTLIAERMRRGRQAKLRAGCLLPWSRRTLRLPARSRSPARSGRRHGRAGGSGRGPGAVRPLSSRTTPACSAWPSICRLWASPRRTAGRAGRRRRCAAS